MGIEYHGPRGFRPPGHFPMKRSSFFIDGLNLYYAIKDFGSPQAKWLNLRALAEHIAGPSEEVCSINFFNALPKWDLEKMQRLQVYLKALRSVGVTVILGRFQEVYRKCRKCDRAYKTFEEKKTDVNIAIHIFRMAFENRYEKAYIVSGDSDLLPAVRAVQQCFPQKEFGVVVPVGQRAKALQSACNTSFKILPAHCKKFRFPDPIKTADDKLIRCPDTWR